MTETEIIGCFLVAWAVGFTSGRIQRYFKQLTESL